MVDKNGGLVKRDVIRVITPGTVLENSMLDESKNNYICSLYYEENAAGLCFADISTGELYVDECHAPDLDVLTHTLQNKLSRYMPSEILLNPQATDLSGLEDFLSIYRSSGAAGGFASVQRKKHGRAFSVREAAYRTGSGRIV